MMDVRGKKVLVVGLARSGVAAARLLASQGALVTANDIKPEQDLRAEADELAALGVALELGQHPESLFISSDLIVVSPGVPSDIRPLQVARRAGVEVISEVELAGRFMRGRLIGITGSNGKTTTTALTGDLMRAAGAEVLVGGNIGTPLTSLVEQTSESSWAVVELSSFQLETICQLRVNVAVITNITPDHLDRHASMDDYAKAKHRIFLNQTAGDLAVLNGEDDGIAEMIRKFGAPRKSVYFSSRDRGSVANIEADIYVREGSICTTLVSSRGDEVEVLPISQVPLRGMHNVENVMAALAATICATGATLERLPVLAEAIRHFTGVEHRLEFVAEVDGIEFYNDSKATNVDSTLKALEAFDGNVVLILGGKDKGGDYAPLVRLIRSRVKHVVLIGAASERIAEQLVGASPMTRAQSMEDAVRQCAEVASEGDTVLLAPACASFDMFDNFEHRGRVFKEAVKAVSGGR